MDSPSNRSMFDTFKDNIWDELGPLDPNWFDDLTFKASTENGNGTEEDTCNTANRDGFFKTPFEKQALDSQLSSTPKIFRRSREESPKTEDEELFSPEREKELLPWTDTSPCLFGTSKDCVSITKPYGEINPQDSFELLATPKKSPAAFAQRISESLGAQVNPDFSWTSSLNTPPAMTPTVILPKTEERTSPVSLTADKHVIFVRKLFPSLSNISEEVAEQSLKKSDEPTVQRAEDADGHGPDPNRNSPDDSPQSSLNQYESDWRQTLPDAIEDGELRDTVAGVLEGAESALSIFFSNSSSALRRVKTKDRIKRKQSISTKEHGCCTSLESSKIAREQTTDDEKLKVPSSPNTGSKRKSKDKDIGITQWTPMSLSDISHCTVDTTCHGKDSAQRWEPNPITEQKEGEPDPITEQKEREPDPVTEQKEREPDPGALVDPSFKSSIGSTVSRKTRTFVYPVQRADPQVQGKDIGLPTQTLGLSPGNRMSGQELNSKPGENTPDEPHVSKNTCDVGYWLQKRGDLTEQNQASSVPTKGQDFEVSQLCRAFAQDLTQMPETNKPGRMNEHSSQMPERNKPGRMNAHSSQKGFSASACLSALKQRNKRLLIKQESSQSGATHHHDCTGISNGVSHLKNSKTESTMNDSGFQSAVTPMTGSSLILPSSEKDAQTQPRPSFKTGSNRTIPFPLITVEKEKALLDNIMEGTATHAISSMNVPNLAKQRQKFGPGTDGKPYTEDTFTRPPGGAKRALDMSMNGKDHTGVPQRVAVSPPSVHASGFRTASNRGIKISAVNLESAVGLFKEIEDESPKCGRNTEDDTGMTCQSLGTSITHSTCPPSSAEKCEDVESHLTASQRADVTELCSLLEDADSQFEFTQFKPAKSHLNSQDNVPSPQRADKELDPDFLTGIDFDDSFSSDAEKDLAKTSDRTTSIPRVNKSCKAPITKSKSTCASFYRTNKENAPTGDALPISKHTSEIIPGIESAKLRADKSDMDRDTETNKPEDKNPLMFDMGFKTARGNAMRISNKSLSKSRALFADLEENPVAISNMADRTDIGLTNWEQAQTSCDKHRGETDLTTRHQDGVEGNTTRNSDLLYIEEDADSLSTGNHDLNNGQKIQVASSIVMESHCSKNRQVPDIQSYEHICKTNQPENGKIDIPTSHGQKGGFQMASGKWIAISAKAIEGAKALFKECDVMESNDCASTSHGKWIIVPEIGSGSYKENNASFNTAQGMRVNTSEKPASGCTELENVNVGPVANHTMTPHHCDEQINNVHFKRPVTNALSRSAKASLIEKPLSSSLCTASTTVGTHGAFSTASGKKISVSDCALTKAKSLLHDCDVFEDKKQKMDTVTTSHPTNLNPVPPPRNSGFQTASGKGVAVSTTALQKAKALLNECDGFEDKKENTKTKVGIRTSRPITPIHHAPPNNGFSTASGKGIAVSTEALQKAKAHLDDNNSNEEIPAFSETKMTDEAHDNPEKIKCAFTTAGGIKVHVSEQNLLKARSLLNESADEKQGESLIKSCLTSSFETSKSHVSNLNSFSGEGFQTASGKGVAVSTTALRKAKALLNKCDGFEDKKENTKTKVGTRTSHPITPIHHAPPKNGFSTASGMGIAVSTEALQKAKAHLDDNNSNEEIPAFSETKTTDDAHDNPEKIKCTFKTAGGIKVNVSEQNLLKARSLLNESVDEKQGESLIKSCLTSSFETSKSHVGNLNSFSGEGFQTAGGKGVAVSTTALRKAKALLNECDGFEDKKENTKTKVGMRTSHPITPIHHAPPKNGFSTASGMGIAVSTEALQKAKAHLDDNNSNEEIIGNLKSFSGEVVSISRNTSDLNTAIEEEVPVQEIPLISLRKTDDVKDGETFRNPGVSCFAKASGKGVSVSEKALKETLKFKEEEIALSKEENLHRRPLGKKLLSASASFTPDQLAPVKVGGLPEHRGMTQSTGKVTQQSSRTKGSSMLNFESLDLSGCTVTQQKYFAQEAMDCTKALLEDEDLADQSLAMPFERLPKQDIPVCSKGSVETGAGKRSMEDTDMTEQPPLKRRLLAEFDRTVNSPRHSTLLPAKSCSDGQTKDRRVFKYNVSLHPNITRPYRDEKTSLGPRLQRAEPQPTTHSTLGDCKPSNSKMAVFIPPFQKIVKAETPKSNVPQVKARTPVFVPPFRRTAARDGSSNPPNKEDQLQHPCGTPSKTDTFVPPPKKTQGPAKATDTERKDDIQSLDSPNVKTVDNGDTSCKNVPIDHGAEDSTARGSAAEYSLSGRQGVVQNLQSLQLARDMQDMRLRKKKRQTIRPLPGSLFLAKTSGVDRVSLRDSVDGRYPVQHTQKQLYGYGVHQHVSEISGENAESFRFNCQQFFKKEVFIEGGGVQLADGGWLIPRNDGTTGKEEFYRALCDSPGVDPKLISAEWVYNHYRWIVWKQACTERSFPAKMGSLCLTPEQVLLQLKYRYDVEVDHSRRPALRKIMERDDTAAKTMVLCICGVVSRGHDPSRQSRSDIKTPQGSDSKAESPVGIVWLTDGWYAIKAQMDVPMTAMLHKGRLAIGGKLIIHGSELVGSQDACPPLEAPESLMLKICANSSRAARWDTKLGFHRDPRPFLLLASSLYSNGGPVGCVDIVVLRSYPVLWMEKKPDGGFVFRCSRAEEKEARRHDDNKHKAMEIVFAKIQAQFEKEENDNNKPRGRRRTLRRQDIERLQEGEELHEAVENDPGYLEARLSEQQLGTLNSYRSSLGEKRQAELQERYHRALDNAQEGEGNCPKRDVTPVWKLCIADSRDQPGSNVYMLNIWRPSMDLQSLLKEGVRHRAYNLTTSEGRKRAGTAAVQFTVTKRTQFQEIQASQEWSAHFQPRISANFVDLQNPESPPQCGEVDLVGYVISVTDGQGSSPVLHLVDGRMNFVKVRCSSSLAQSGLEDLVKPLALLAVSNLQLRPQSSTHIPVLYAGDLAFISTNPKEAHLQEAFTQLRNLDKEYLKSAEERLSHLVQSDGLNSISSPALQPRTPRQNTRTCMTTQQPVRGFGSFTPLTRNPPSASSSAEKDPRSLKRKRGLDYLSRIPSPPPVCPLGATASLCVSRTFNPPRRSGTPSDLKTVQTPVPRPVLQPLEDEWVNDEELAMIDTQALHGRPGQTV